MKLIDVAGVIATLVIIILILKQWRSQIIIAGNAPGSVGLTVTLMKDFILHSDDSM